MDRRSTGREIGRGDELSLLVAFGEDEEITLLRTFVGAWRILARARLRGTTKAGGRGERAKQQCSPRLFYARVDFRLRGALGR